MSFQVHPLYDAAAEKVTFYLTVAMGSGTVVLDWFGSNAAGIGAICTVISCAVYVSVNAYKMYRDNRNEK